MPRAQASRYDVGVSQAVNPPGTEPAHRRAARYAWALLLARIYEVFPLVCTNCGGAMIAVGIRIAAHPPHRSQRARLRHWALTLDG